MLKCCESYPMEGLNKVKISDLNLCTLPERTMFTGI